MRWIPSAVRPSAAKYALCAVTALLAAAAATGCGSGGGSASAGSGGDGSSATTFYGGVGSMSAEEWVQFGQGAKAVVASLHNGSSYEPKASDFDGEKLLQTLSAQFARPCDSCVLAADPASSAFTKAIVERAVKADVPTVTLWNKPANIHPWDSQFDGKWVAHMAFDGVDSGYRNANALIDAIGGKGQIVALMGIPDNPPAKQRLQGLKKALAEHPGVKLLDVQVADWDSNKAQQVTETWLAKYGDQIDGVFSESDGMAVGAVAALRAKGLNGKIPVTGSDGNSDGLRLVKSGDAVSTMYIDPTYMGAISEAMAYAAKTGAIDPSKLTHDQRQFYLKQTLITKDNVDEYLHRKVDPAQLSYQRLSKDLWAHSAGPIHD